MSLPNAAFASRRAACHRLVELAARAHDAHALTAAAGRRLDDQRRLVGRGNRGARRLPPRCASPRARPRPRRSASGGGPIHPSARRPERLRRSRRSRRGSRTRDGSHPHRPPRPRGCARPASRSDAISIVSSAERACSEPVSSGATTATVASPSSQRGTEDAQGDLAAVCHQHLLHGAELAGTVQPGVRRARLSTTSVATHTPESTRYGTASRGRLRERAAAGGADRLPGRPREVDQRGRRSRSASPRVSARFESSVIPGREERAEREACADDEHARARTPGRARAGSAATTIDATRPAASGTTGPRRSRGVTEQRRCCPPRAQPEQRKTAPIATAPIPAPKSRRGASTRKHAEEEQCGGRGDQPAPRIRAVARRLRDERRWSLWLVGDGGRRQRSPRDECERRDRERPERPADPGRRCDAADDRPEQRAPDGRGERAPDQRAAPRGRRRGDEPAERAGPRERARHSLQEAGEVELPRLLADPEEHGADRDRRHPDQHRQLQRRSGRRGCRWDRAEKRSGGVRGREDARARLTSESSSAK